MKKNIIFYRTILFLIIQMAFNPKASLPQSESSGYESITATFFTKTESRVNSKGEREYRTCYTSQIECHGSGSLSCVPTFETQGCTPWA